MFREPTQTITSSQRSYRRRFGSLRWLKASEHLGISVQGPYSSERSDAGNSHSCPPRPEFVVPFSITILQLTRICMIPNTHHATDTYFFAERTFPKKKNKLNSPGVRGYSQFRAHAESKFLHYWGSSTGSSRPSHRPLSRLPSLLAQRRQPMPRSACSRQALAKQLLAF